MLADYFVESYNKTHGKNVRRIATSALDLLTAYHWPGNVRELENCIERAVLLSADDVIHGHQLPPSLQTAEATGTRLTGGLLTQLDNVERTLILDALKSTRGNITAAARLLDVTERVMGLRVSKHAIDPRRFKRQ
jgi:Nif-specific regulatory protein